MRGVQLKSPSQRFEKQTLSNLQSGKITPPLLLYAPPFLPEQQPNYFHLFISHHDARQDQPTQNERIITTTTIINAKTPNRIEPDVQSSSSPLLYCML